MPRLSLFSIAFAASLLAITISNAALADGLVRKPRNYEGSLEERGQEAIIIFQEGKDEKKAVEDLILKIRVEGEAKSFAWIVPFPNEPKIGKEDPKLFQELFAYVQARQVPKLAKSGAKTTAQPAAGGVETKAVEVISRQVVGDFDIAVVRENKAGGLNPWLEKEGFQPLVNADDVLDFYRKKNYVYACIKVSSEALAKEKQIESHPLRFTFSTGGRDGIYFPMKLTGLQSKPFDVNLYVLYRFWLNDKLSKYGYRHRGFELTYRDWDSPQCEPNGGKQYSLPEEDPFLKGYGRLFPSLTKLCQKLHPGEKYYLTNIQAYGLKPEDVRVWPDDLWLFPYYTNRDFVPYDAREGAVAP
ncbi:MAG: DUF2330 domain-containing protein [Planctomycetales bacterium]|nr:DUF2330 domain-containing protein [Planctomycetales bacterium]